MAFGRLAMINIASGLGQIGNVVLLASLGQGDMAMAWAGLVAVLLRTLGANIARPMSGPSARASGAGGTSSPSVPGPLPRDRQRSTIFAATHYRARARHGDGGPVRPRPDSLPTAGQDDLQRAESGCHAGTRRACPRGGSLKEPYLLGLSYMTAVYVRPWCAWRCLPNLSS